MLDSWDLLRVQTSPFAPVARLGLGLADPPPMRLPHSLSEVVANERTPLECWLVCSQQPLLAVTSVLKLPFQRGIAELRPHLSGGY